MKPEQSERTILVEELFKKTIAKNTDMMMLLERRKTHRGRIKLEKILWNLDVKRII